MCIRDSDWTVPEEIGAVSDLLSQNQLKAVEEVKQLEKSYRTVMLFYKNTDSDKIKMCIRDSPYPMTIKFAISAQTVKMDEATFVQDWPENN